LLNCGSWVKHVWIDGGDLVVSNYFKDVRVPASEIAEVFVKNGKKGPRAITVTFKSRTQFGTFITFMPPMQFGLFWDDSIPNKLRNMMSANEPRPGLRGDEQ
jgi:hypothetical protein